MKKKTFNVTQMTSTKILLPSVFNPWKKVYHLLVVFFGTKKIFFNSSHCLVSTHTVEIESMLQLWDNSHRTKFWVSMCECFCYSFLGYRFCVYFVFYLPGDIVSLAWCTCCVNAKIHMLFNRIFLRHKCHNGLFTIRKISMKFRRELHFKIKKW